MLSARFRCSRHNDTARYAVNVSFDELAQAADHLRRSGVVALPTDTQYALSAIATDDQAVAAVFRLKRRPGGENLPVFLPPARWREHLEQIAESLDQRMWRLAEAAWPGALTLIVKKRPEWSTAAVDGSTIALRIPITQSLPNSSISSTPRSQAPLPICTVNRPH